MLSFHHKNLFCDTVDQAYNEDPEGDEGEVDGREELVLHVEVEQDQPEGDRQEWKRFWYLPARFCLMLHKKATAIFFSFFF